jgi:hypothetical protein
VGSMRGQVRVEETRREVDVLNTELTNWLRRRRKSDQLHQYETQLNALEAALTGPLKAVRDALDATADLPTSGEVYAACRVHERRMVLVRRVWNYFRAKFDQRDDAQLGPVLAAADEVIWSCYAEPFARAAEALRDSSGGPIRGSAPLPYVESVYAPEAIPRDRPPADLRPDRTDNLVYEFFKVLPIPVVALPAACVDAPWWLAYLGHEVGHHLQYDLVAEQQLVIGFADVLEGALTAAAAPGQVDSNDVGRWRSWAVELFADACSVCSVGAAAVRAMLELEMDTPASMLRAARPGYPAPVVRLAFLADVAHQLGLDGHAALGQLDPAALVKHGAEDDDTLRRLRSAAAHDLDLVPAVVAAVLAFEVVGGLRLPDLYEWSSAEFRSGGTVADWTQTLQGPEAPYPERSIRGARLMISSGLDAWHSVSSRPAEPAERESAQIALARALVPVVARSREEGTRESQVAQTQLLESLSKTSAQLILSAEPGLLEF